MVSSSTYHVLYMLKVWKMKRPSWPWRNGNLWMYSWAFIFLSELLPFDIISHTTPPRVSAVSRFLGKIEFPTIYRFRPNLLRPSYAHKLISTSVSSGQRQDETRAQSIRIQARRADPTINWSSLSYYSSQPFLCHWPRSRESVAISIKMRSSRSAVIRTATVPFRHCCTRYVVQSFKT